MQELSRRQLLTSAAAGAAALAVPRMARAHCGPADVDDRRVLEIFLKGGFDPWRSWWFEPVFRDLAKAPDWAQFTNSYTSTTIDGFKSDTLGAAAYPLASNLANRCRVAVMAHDLEPHEAAVPYSITGTKLGRPKFASLAAAVNEHHADALKAFVIDCGNALAARYAAEPGTYGSQWRPPVVKVGDPYFVDLLARTDRQRFDDVETLLTAQYGDKLVHAQTAPLRVRSRAMEAFDGASYLLHERNLELMSLLSATSLDTAPAVKSWDDNNVRVGVRVGAELLQGDVRYVCVVDSGVYKQYDTHDAENLGDQTDQIGNMWNLCEILAQLDGEGLLEDVLVVLNTEFGRLNTTGGDVAAAMANNADGTEHWPYAYVNVLMGAPFSRVRHRGSIETAGGDPNSPDFCVAMSGAQGNGPYEPQHIRAVLGDYLGIDVSRQLDPDELSPLVPAPPIEDTLPQLNAELLEGDTCV